MNYLFFDLEFASCRGGYHKICEFGYALTDASFSLIERENFFINPLIRRNEWDFFALKKIIKKRISDFTSKPSLTEYYPKIRALFERADFVFGHSTVGDVQALNQECKRFSLSPLVFPFFDLSEFYRKFTHGKDQRALTAILSDLSLSGDERAHDAESDAFNTMLCVQELLRRESEEMLFSHPEDAFKMFLSKYSIAERNSKTISSEPHRKKPRALSEPSPTENETKRAETPNAPNPDETR